MSSLITACPTLCNPEAFHTVPELRTELHRANVNLLDSCERLHSLAVQHNTVLDWVTLIASHHESGNADEVKKLLDKVIANKQRLEKSVH